MNPSQGSPIDGRKRSIPPINLSSSEIKMPVSQQTPDQNGHVSSRVPLPEVSKIITFTPGRRVPSVQEIPAANRTIALRRLNQQKEAIKSIISDLKEEYSSNPKAKGSIEAFKLLDALNSSPSCFHELQKIYGLSVNVERQIRRWFHAERIFNFCFKDRQEAPKSFHRCGGRLEICGHHTDHQGGDAIAASTNLDTLVLASPSGDNKIRIFSHGYRNRKHPKGEPHLTLEIPSSPTEKLPKLTGVISNFAGLVNGFRSRGYEIGGFDAVVLGDIPAGSGASSSAALHMVMGQIVSEFFNQGKVPLVEIARVSQKYIEGEQWGKKSGLLDQIGCAHGGPIYANFNNPEMPEVAPISFDALHKEGFSIGLISTGTSHEGDKRIYNIIPRSMNKAAKLLKIERLSDITPEEFFSIQEDLISALVKAKQSWTTYKPLNMASHYYGEIQRVESARSAIAASVFKQDEIYKLFQAVDESGQSSQIRLRNTESKNNHINSVLDVVRSVCNPQAKSGAVRLMGGGWGGALIVFVKTQDLGLLASKLRPFASTGVRLMPIEVSAYGALNLSEHFSQACIQDTSATFEGRGLVS